MHHLKLQTGTAGVRIGDGALGLKWQVAESRVLGLVRILVLNVSFRFAGLNDAQRYTFMQRFDLYMQRGGAQELADVLIVYRRLIALAHKRL